MKIRNVGYIDLPEHIGAGGFVPRRSLIGVRAADFVAHEHDIERLVREEVEKLRIM